MRQMTTNIVVSHSREMPSVLRATEPVRQIDMKEKRRKRVAELSNIINKLHKETLARLAK